MGIAIANRKNRCDFGALSPLCLGCFLLPEVKDFKDFGPVALPSHGGPCCSVHHHRGEARHSVQRWIARYILALLSWLSLQDSTPDMTGPELIGGGPKWEADF